MPLVQNIITPKKKEETAEFPLQGSEAVELNGSHAVLQAFLAEDVEVIFGYPGGAIMPIYDALYDYHDRLNHILVRHEQGAIHAAQGFARASGKTGVVFGQEILAIRLLHILRLHL